MLTALGVPGISARIFRPNGAIVLMYHSVARPAKAKWIDPANHVPAAIFEEQMQFLAAHRRVLPLAMLTDMVRAGDSPPTGSIAITFDDGYLDNLTVAAPILESFELPATLFLATGYINRVENQWIDQVYATFRCRSRKTLRWPDGTGHSVSLDDPSQQQQSYRLVCESLLSASSDARGRLLAHLRSELQPIADPPRLTLDWEDAKRLTSSCRFMSLGAHTVEHLDLTACDDDRAQQEIEQSKAQIEEHSHVAVRSFSFPYGRTSPRLRSLAQHAGFTEACGGGVSPLLSNGTDPFAVGRVAAPRSMRDFAFLTSSANSGLLHRCMRL